MNTTLESLYKTYGRQMISLAYQILQNYHDAEEAVFDAFFSVSKRIEFVSELDEQEQKNYCLQSAKNKAKTLYNKRRKIIEHEANLTDEEWRLIAAEDPLEVIEKSDQTETIEILKNLPEIYRDVLYMHYVEEMSVKEIAKELDTKSETIKKRLLRAKAMVVAERRSKDGSRI